MKLFIYLDFEHLNPNSQLLPQVHNALFPVSSNLLVNLNGNSE
jgi:hypothetical protein